MAKKRKDSEESSDKPFKIPKFDEEKFLKKERRNIRATLISVGFGLIMAIICFGFWVLMGPETDLRWPLVFFVALANAVFLRYLYEKTNIDTSDFTNKNWFTNFAIYFFSWLIIFIVIVNPPFYDGENPRIETAVLPDVQEPGGDVLLVAKITDNTYINKEDITLEITKPNSTVITPDFTYENNILRYTYLSPTNVTEDQKYDFKITAVDPSGREAIKKGSFTFSYDAIKIPDPQGTDTPPGPSVTYTTSIIFDVSADVDRVYYTVDDSDPINATYSKDTGYYITTPKKKGWEQNENVTVNAYAKTVYYFLNVPEEFNNTIVDADNYYFSVSDASEIGEEPSKEINMPQPRYIMVPGFEAIAFLVSLGIVVLIFKYRKKEKK